MSDRSDRSANIVEPNFRESRPHWPGGRATVPAFGLHPLRANSLPCEFSAATGGARKHAEEHRRELGVPSLMTTVMRRLLLRWVCWKQTQIRSIASTMTRKKSSAPCFIKQTAEDVPRAGGISTLTLGTTRAALSGLRDFITMHLHWPTHGASC
jgi:hypothetical protein